MEEPGIAPTVVMEGFHFTTGSLDDLLRCRHGRNVVVLHDGGCGIT